MPTELILSSDTLNIGRIKINDFYNSASGLWSGGSGTQSIVAAASQNTTVGDYSLIAGKMSSGITGNYGSITGGKLNRIRGNFSHISGGYQINIGLNGSYKLAGNGKQNYIKDDFGTILNGRNQFVNGAYTTIINGNRNYIDAGPPYKYNAIINGYKNRIGAGGGFVVNHNTILNGNRNSIYDSRHCVTFGYQNFCGGDYQFVAGKWAAASSSYCFTFGKGTSTVSRLTNPGSAPFTAVWGNGARMIRMRFAAAGGANSSINLNGTGQFNATGADYGEYFEWEDQNSNSEERTGFFVELSNGKIKIANSNNVLGIVSKTTSYIGDANEDYWSEMFLKDEWGSPIQRKFYKYSFGEKNSKVFVYFDENGKSLSRVPNTDEENGDFIDGYIKENGKYIEEVVVNKYHPNFNKEAGYVGRSQRKEWSVIGLLGKLRVRTSEQITGQFVDVDTSTGMAKNGTKYHVMSKNKDFDGNYGIVTIFFK